LAKHWRKNFSATQIGKEMDRKLCRYTDLKETENHLHNTEWAWNRATPIGLKPHRKHFRISDWKELKRTDRPGLERNRYVDQAGNRIRNITALPHYHITTLKIIPIIKNPAEAGFLLLE
jgi:hypothetical protein